MKKLIVSILMIIGLSISSQVNDVQRTTKPTIVATPDVINPNTGTGVQRISCSGGSGYYVSDGCVCCNIYCTNGNRYTICNDGSSVFLRVAKPNTNPKASTININIDINTSLIGDLSATSDSIEKVVNIKKIENAIIELKSELTIEYTNYTLIITPGVYEITGHKLQALSVLK